jgi:ribosome maturation factor RimP
MSNFRTLTAWAMLALIYSLPFSDSETLLKAATPFESNSVKQEVSQFGVGAAVKVKLAGGARFRGSIQAIEDGGFLLNTGSASPAKMISYDQLAQVKLAKLTYTASGHADVIEVRRVITALGAGKHIVVKTTGREEYHGNVQSIEQDHFTMLPDLRSTPVRIAYSEVVATGPNLSTASKIAIVVIAVVVVVVVVVAVALHKGPKVGF